MIDKERIKRFAETIGVTGYEDEIRKSIFDSLPDGEKYIDNIGNVVFVQKSKSEQTKKVMFIAHMDEVGYQIMHKNADGTYSIKPLGNIKTWNSINQRVVSAEGKKAFLYCENSENIGAHEFEKIKAISISGKLEVGDVLSFDAKTELNGETIIGKALDNRVSCEILIESILEIKETNAEIYFVFTTQEEVGMRGARVAVTTIDPDIVLTIDVSPVGDRNSLELEKGVGIKMSDSIGVSDSGMVHTSKKIAEVNDIKYQMEVSDCGTSELIITNEKDKGAKKIGFSIPCKNMHSSATIVKISDVEACKKMVLSVIRSLY